MKSLFGMGGTAGTAATVAAGVVVAAGGIAAVTVLQDAPPSPGADPEVAVVVPSDVSTQTSSSEDVGEVANEPQPTIPEPVAELPAPPAFDVVRVDPEGNALLAGRGVAGATVGVLIDGQEAHRARVDASGNFAAIFAIQRAATPQVVSLVMDAPDFGSIASTETVILSPAEAETLERSKIALGGIIEGLSTPKLDADGAAIVASTGGSAPLTTSLASLADAPQGEASLQAALTEAPAPLAKTAPLDEAEPTKTAAIESLSEGPSLGPVASETAVPQPPLSSATAPTQQSQAPSQKPTVLIADEDGLRVVQDGGPSTVASQTVIIDSISYDSAGEVALAGRGAGSGFVRVYLNNRPLKTTEIGSDGQWRTALPDVDTGVYTLRVDELNDKGEVTSRMETPFKREAPAAIARLAKMDADNAVSGLETEVIVVQPGHSLWRIARERYGKGELYVQVYRANKDDIRDPDLIYPGQIFDLPEG